MPCAKLSREKKRIYRFLGDVLILKDGVYIPDKDKTEERRKRILALQEDLWA